MKQNISLSKKAELALRAAMIKVVEENRRLGLPIILWRNGKVAHVPATRVARALAKRKSAPIHGK